MATSSSKNNLRLTVIAQSVGLALAALAAGSAFAADITNPGTVSDIYVSSQSIAGAISNTGIVTGGIYVESGSSVSSGITNSGTVGRLYISSSAINNGITNSGTIGYVSIRNGSTVAGGISNTGTISGSTQGLYLYGSSVSGGITNHAGATISASDKGLYINSSSSVTGGIHNDGVITATGSLSGGTYSGGNAVLIEGYVDSVENSGTISGNVYAIYVYDNASVAGGITNTGVLNGDVYIGNSTLNLNGTTGQVHGSISGSTDSLVNVNGVYALEKGVNINTLNINSGGKLTSGNSNDAWLNLDTLNINNGGTLTAGIGYNYVDNINIANGGRFNMTSGNGSGQTQFVYSDVANSGTLSVAGQNNTISGYTQTSTGVFQTEVSGATNYGQLTVFNTADLTQGSIKVNTGTPNLALINGQTNTILSAGTLNFNSNIAVTDTSLLFDFQAAQVGNTIQLTTVTSTNSGNTATGSVNSQGNSASQGAAAVFDNLIAQGGSAPASMQPVVTALGALGSQKAVSDAISETLPLMTAGMTQSTLNTLHGTNQVIQSRQEANLGRSSGDEFLGDRQFWFKPLGSWAKQNDRNGVAGYDADTYGMVFGVDGTLSDKSSIGGAFAYTSTKVDSNSNVAKQHADVDGYQLAVYGAYKLDNNTSITYQGDIGNNQVSGDRRIAFMGSTANSDFSSWSAHVGAGIGKTMDLSERTTFTPSVRFDYTRLRTDGYTEKGAGALNLHVDGDTVEELILGVDAAFSHTLSTNASLVGNLGVGYDTMNEQSSVAASYVGGGAAFATKGIDPSPWVMRGGFGVVMHNGPLVSVTARYDLEARESFTNQTASVKVGIKF